MPDACTGTLISRDVVLTAGHCVDATSLSAYRVYRSTDPASAAAFIDVTSADDDDTDTFFLDNSAESTVFYLVTGVGPQGEGPKGHFGE